MTEASIDPPPSSYSPKNTAKRHPLRPAIMVSAVKAWAAQEKNGLKDFVLAQCKVAAVLAVAHFGNAWEPAYQRNENHSPPTFWLVNAILLVGAALTWKWNASSVGRGGGSTARVVMLGREQTEEWKGWMQWAFIFYHYYRVWSVYNEIRVFVSAYVWMTGFGNFLYFDKKGDFSVERFVSMIIRINYFPLLLSFFLNVDLDLYYVVPLHTTGFVLTMVTCFVGYKLERFGLSYWKSRTLAIGLCLVVHILFYETPAVDILKLFSDEYHFRFQADKYSAWMGMACGLLWGKVGEYMQWAHGFENESRRRKASVIQFTVGVGLIAFWYCLFGHIDDKYTYNPIHPYVFVFAVIGWLLVRNCTRYLTECHSSLLEFLGRNTLETYVLQFHLFMNHKVQFIPVVIPGSDSEGAPILKFLNMLLCGSIFLTVAVCARKITVATQMSVVDLVKRLRGTVDTSVTVVAPQQQAQLKAKQSDLVNPEEAVELTSLESGMSNEKTMD